MACCAFLCAMAAVRLTDGQKEELVGRFRQGAGLQELAEAYGCSPNTVSRTAKALLGAEAYERLKAERAGRRGAALAPSSDSRSGGSGLIAAEAGSTPAPEMPASAPLTAPEIAAESDDPADFHGELAIDDADDFRGDDDDPLADDDGLAGDDGGSDEPVSFLPRPAADGGEIRPLPFQEASLPAAAWMLVDEKTVALQPRPLREFPELSGLPAEELERQALSLYLTQRQAKRLCGRSQRVIPIPDPAIFVITSPYLLRQDITRVVIEGALYALPGS